MRYNSILLHILLSCDDNKVTIDSWDIEECIRKPIDADALDEWILL